MTVHRVQLSQLKLKIKINTNCSDNSHDNRSRSDPDSDDGISVENICDVDVLVATIVCSVGLIVVQNSQLNSCHLIIKADSRDRHAKRYPAEAREKMIDEVHSNFGLQSTPHTLIDHPN